jgi:hypothetical protein
MEHQIKIKFCFRLYKTATETHKMLETVNGNEDVSQTLVIIWFKRFREDLQNNPRSGWLLSA